MSSQFSKKSRQLNENVNSPIVFPQINKMLVVPKKTVSPKPRTDPNTSKTQTKTRLKRFLSQAEIDKIISMKQQNIPTKEIAEELGITTRHVRDIYNANRPEIQKEFTTEEDFILFDQILNQNITSPAKIRKFIPNKQLYMIRNRIKYLNKIGLLKVVPHQISTIPLTDEICEGSILLEGQN